MRLLAAGLLAVSAAVPQPGRETLLLQHPVHIAGIVMDAAGNPVQGASVLHGNTGNRDVETDTEGKFALETNAPSVVIQKPGYRSQRVDTRGTQEVRITLELFSKQVPLCEETASRVGMDGVEAVGFYFQKFPELKTTQPKWDVDYVARTYFIALRKKKYGVWHGTGPTWGDGEPFDENVWKSTEFEEVDYDMHGHADVVDARGVLPNGNHWRNLGSFNVSASYDDVPPEAAAVLDKLLDSACWKASTDRPSGN